LCDQLGDSPQRGLVLLGLIGVYMMRGELRTSQALAEECLQLVEQTNESRLLTEAHVLVGNNCLFRGEFVRVRASLEQAVAHYQPQHQTPIIDNPKVMSLDYRVLALWSLGYPEQALRRSHEALCLAQELGHPYGLVFTLIFAVMVHLWRRDGRVAQEHADAMVALSSEHGFSRRVAEGTVLRSEALIAQGQWAEGVAQVRQGLEENKAELRRTYHLAWLAEGYRGAGQLEEGLAVVEEALRLVDKNDERFYEAELYRIKGELTLQKFQVPGSKFQAADPRSLTPDPQAEAEECFLKAIAIAQKQQAKSLELRATMSLARLWQSQGKTAEARQILTDIYSWFTEGFDTKDLQETKALLEKLA